LACHLLTSCKRNSLLLDFHRLTAAGDCPVAGLGNNHLGAALGAAVSFSYLISHIASPLCVSLSYLIISLKDNHCKGSIMLIILTLSIIEGYPLSSWAIVVSL
jgi:hypothetical protein